MGTSRWNPHEWRSKRAEYSHKQRDEIFTSYAMDPALDPALIDMRESRDSAQNPQSTPVIVAVDVTGSMGILAEELVRHGLGPLFEEIIKRKPISDPHVMAMGIGDAYCDRAPLQVTQFEADLVITDQIEKIYLEGGGGGNNHESYNLPWLFAARKTAIDSYEKRGKKGYLFTVGDEQCPPGLKADQIKQFLGIREATNMSSQEILKLASEKYEIFHLIVEEGHYARSQPKAVLQSWTSVLGQRAMRLSDYTRLSEVIVSAIQINEGEHEENVISSWSDKTSDVVARATEQMLNDRGWM